MPEVVSSRIKAEWPTWMKRVQVALLVVAVIAALGLPILLLSMASNSLSDNLPLQDENLALLRDDPTLASEILEFRCGNQKPLTEDQASITENQTSLRKNQTLICENQTRADKYSAWSEGLVVIGPNLFITSLLAMVSKWQKWDRLIIGGIVTFGAAVFYYYLFVIGEGFLISVILGFAGVLYCLATDFFTPSSKPKVVKGGGPSNVGAIGGSTGARTGSGTSSGTSPVSGLSGAEAVASTDSAPTDASSRGAAESPPAEGYGDGAHGGAAVKNFQATTHAPHTVPNSAFQLGDLLAIVVLPIVAIALDLCAVLNRQPKVEKSQRRLMRTTTDPEQE